MTLRVRSNIRFLAFRHHWSLQVRPNIFFLYFFVITGPAGQSSCIRVKQADDAAWMVDWGPSKCPRTLLVASSQVKVSRGYVGDQKSQNDDGVGVFM